MSLSDPHGRFSASSRQKISLSSSFEPDTVKKVKTGRYLDADTGELLSTDPVAILEAIENAALKHLEIDEIKIGIELEFTLIEAESSESGVPRPRFSNKTSRFFHEPSHRTDIDPSTKREILSHIFLELQRRGISAQGFSLEEGLNQFEISSGVMTLIEAAEFVLDCRKAIPEITWQIGYNTIFAPKPWTHGAHNGLHINLSLWKDDVNLLQYRRKPKRQNWVERLNWSLPLLTGLTNPTRNGHKRLVAEFSLHSANSQKGPKICQIVNEYSETAARIEIRSPDILCNPYLAISAILIALQTDLLPSIRKPNTKKRNTIFEQVVARDKFPRDLFEAGRRLKLQSGSLIEEALIGPDIIQWISHYCMAKHIEGSLRVIDFDFEETV